MISTTKFEPEDFESWFNRLASNESVMSLLFQIYQYDQIGKIQEKSFTISLLVKEQVIRTTENNIEQLSEVLSFGLIDNVLDSRNKKRAI